MTTIAHSIQSYNTHQQDVDQILQQLAAIQASLTLGWNMISADLWNLEAKMRNEKIPNATRALVVMRSIEPGPNPQVPVNQPIPNFPATPNDVSLMTRQQCGNLLTSLDNSFPLGPQAGARQLRTAVRQAIGLPDL